MRTPLPPAVRWLYNHLLEFGLLLAALYAFLVYA